MNPRHLVRGERGSWSLIGLLAALVIGLLLVIMFVGPGLKDSGGKSRAGQAMDKAKEVECQSNLQQIRYAIQIYHSNREAFPGSISQIEVGTNDPSFFKCPIGREDYTYDSQTGTIHCPHSGHEDF